MDFFNKLKTIPINIAKSIAKINEYKPQFGANIFQSQLYQGLQGARHKSVVAKIHLKNQLNP